MWLHQLLLLYWAALRHLPQVDAEEFEDNPEEFIRRDIEGSDRFTRRKSACDLLRNMRRNFDAQISDLALTVIQTLLRKYAANPAAPQAWMAKETAVQMYLAVGISGFTVRNGVSEENINPHMKAKADVVCISDCLSEWRCDVTRMLRPSFVCRGFVCFGLYGAA